MNNYQKQRMLFILQKNTGFSHLSHILGAQSYWALMAMDLLMRYYNSQCTTEKAIPLTVAMEPSVPVAPGYPYQSKWGDDSGQFKGGSGLEVGWAKGSLEVGGERSWWWQCTHTLPGPDLPQECPYKRVGICLKWPGTYGKVCKNTFT